MRTIQWGVSSEKEATKSAVEILCLRSGDMYYLEERVQDASNAAPARRVRAYDGRELKFYEAMEEGGPCSGLIHSLPLAFGAPNDILHLCGYGITRLKTDRADLEFIDGGREICDGHSCRLVVMKGPYTEGHEAYTYWWIDDSGARLRIIRHQCLIDDDPEKAIVEAHYHYGAADDARFPSFIEYARLDRGVYEDADIWWQHYKEVRVMNIEVNRAIADEEIEFKFPEGTAVYDSVSNIHYVVGEKGGADLALDELVPAMQTGEVPSPAPTTVQVNTVSPTRDDESARAESDAPIAYGPPPYALLLASGAFIVFSFALIVIYHRRTRRGNDRANDVT